MEVVIYLRTPEELIMLGEHAQIADYLLRNLQLHI